jgi:hypothetical protein
LEGCTESSLLWRATPAPSAKGYARILRILVGAKYVSNAAYTACEPFT